MLQKTRGLVLNHFKYQESSIIVRIYTEELGLQSYLVNGIRSSRSRQRMALYQPLTLLHLVVYFKKNRSQINRISEAKCYDPFVSIPFDWKKSTMALFITEILVKTLKEEGANRELFSFLYDSVCYFDQSGENYENFHLYFLLKLSRYLGFAPQSGREVFEQIQEYKPLRINEKNLQDLGKHLDRLIQHDYQMPCGFSAIQRSELIDYLLDYYRLHMEGFQQVRSLTVLRELNR